MKHILSAYVYENNFETILISKYKFFNFRYKAKILHKKVNSWNRKYVEISDEEKKIIISNWGNEIYRNFILRLFANQSIDNVKFVQIEIGNETTSYLKTK
jgi:hypothetical protein